MTSAYRRQLMVKEIISGSDLYGKCGTIYDVDSNGEHTPGLHKHLMVKLVHLHERLAQLSLVVYTCFIVISRDTNGAMVLQS